MPLRAKTNKKQKTNKTNKTNKQNKNNNKNKQKTNKQTNKQTKKSSTFYGSEHSLSSFNQIFMRPADNLHRQEISDGFEFRPDWTIDFGVTYPLVPKNAIFDLFQSIACLVLTGSLWKLQMTWTGIISDEFEFRQNHTIHFGVTCHCVPIKTYSTFKGSERSPFSFNQISMRLADNMHRHKISDKFEFRLDRTIDLGVTCPLVPKTPYSTLSDAKPA